MHEKTVPSFQDKCIIYNLLKLVNNLVCLFYKTLRHSKKETIIPLNDDAYNLYFLYV